ncbi:MAG: DNA alkylation repair protein [Actinomycetia bacterium]|nr:DNA alkylation repair protein [Actinomycetes bacterium]
MAEPLKNSFGPNVIVAVADMLAQSQPDFDREGFIELGSSGFEELELTARARHLSSALAEMLPTDRGIALDIITNSLGATIDESELTGMEGFRYLPFVLFVAEHGLDHFEQSMTAQYELTQRFTAEFSIRAFITRYPDETMERLRLWATDDSVHVRRLVSEGTRPRLPWASRLPQFQADPTPVLDLLELLKDDSEEYVRRSVANNLNDISKDNPSIAVATATEWWNDEPNRRRLVRHGLRTLIKEGDPDALAVLGYIADSPVNLASITIEPSVVQIGDSIRMIATLDNATTERHDVLVDFIVWFMKADGKVRPKVFKGKELSIEGGDTAVISKKISIAQHSTRTHYPGTHRVDVQINGVSRQGADFSVVPGTAPNP